MKLSIDLSNTSPKESAEKNKKGQKTHWILLLAVIFLTASVVSVLSILTVSFENVFSLSRLYSVQLFTTFLALLYCSSIIGGLFGGRLTSYAYGVNIGLFFAILGLLGLYCCHQTNFLIFSLSLLVIGYGLVSPCVISIFGQNLKQSLVGNQRYHSGFILNYMGMNIGGVLGASLSGFWRDPSQYQNNFLFGIFFLLCLGSLLNYMFSADSFKNAYFINKKLNQNSLVFRWMRRNLFLNNFLGSFLEKLEANFKSKNQGKIKLKIMGLLKGFFIKLWAIIFLCLSVFLVNKLLASPYVADAFLISLSFLTVGYVLFLGKKEDKSYFKRLIFFMFLTTVTIFFFVLYNSEPDILTIFIEDHVDRDFLGVTIPSSTYFMLNPFFNLVFGGAIFLALKFFKKSFSPDIWIYTSIFFMGFGFWVLWLAIFFSPSGNIPTGWIILVYAILSGSEMLLAPVAYEIVFIYGVPSLYGVMTGMSQLAIGLGALATEHLSRFIIPKPDLSMSDSLHFFSRGFIVIGFLWMLFGLIFLWVKRQMRQSDVVS